MCDNALTVRLPALEAAVLRTLRDDVLTPDVIEAVVTRAIMLRAEAPDALAARRQRLDSERRTGGGAP